MQVFLYQNNETWFKTTVVMLGLVRANIVPFGVSILCYESKKLLKNDNARVIFYAAIIM